VIVNNHRIFSRLIIFSHYAETQKGCMLTNGNSLLIII